MCQTKLEEFLPDLEQNPDPVHTWRTIKALSDFPASTAFNDRLVNNGHTLSPVEVVLRPGRSGGPSLGVLALSVAFRFIPGEGCRGRREEAATLTPQAALPW